MVVGGIGLLLGIPLGTSSGFTQIHLDVRVAGIGRPLPEFVSGWWARLVFGLRMDAKR
jgi:hypothetical protein